MRKSLIAGILCIAMCVALMPSVLAEGQHFTDVPTSFWGYDDIEYVAEKGIVNGVGDGKFAPNMEVSSAQFATMLVRAFFGNELEAVDQSKVMQTWYGPSMSVARSEWLFSNTKTANAYQSVDGRDSWKIAIVEAPMNRTDMAQMICNLARKYSEYGLKLSVPTDVAAAREKIPDYDSIPLQNQAAVYGVYTAGILQGVDANGTFNGTAPLTRAQTAAVLARFLRNYSSILEAAGASQSAAAKAVQEENERLEEMNSKRGQSPEGYTYAGNVNSVKNVGKEDAYPTKSLEGVTTPNKNGYYTKATNVDYGDAHLVYELLELTNQSRREAGLEELEWAPYDEAEEYTLLRAYECSDWNTYGHKRPCGGNCGLSGENIGYGYSSTAQSMHKAWMNSHGHKRAILDNTKDDRYKTKYMTAANCGSGWVVCFWDDNSLQSMARGSKAASNYHSRQCPLVKK